jgi:tRNA(Ile2) C34 agmatinyltransferase TiaS
MAGSEITGKDRKRAARCLNDCKVCAYARRRQKGLIFRLVKIIEGPICPYCRAYAKVYGRKAHEPMI